MKGKHQVKALPYAYDKLKGISEQVNKWHHDKHYAGYVAKRNEIEKKLDELIGNKEGNANFSEFGELKRRETFNASGQILHEIYYDIMGGDGNADSSLAVYKKIEEDFGSFDNWLEDFKETAKASLGWAILCYDPSDGALHNYLVDFHNGGAVWGAVPLVPVDVFEHAYYYDNGPDRGAYINAFIDNLNWNKINEFFENAAK
ncbi:superoxide dismutase [bacterium]|nr:superoxide dismutase [bacterium]